MAQMTHLVLRPILAMLRLLQQVNLGDLPHLICPILLHPRGRRPRLRPPGIDWFGLDNICENAPDEPPRGYHSYPSLT